ncbi:MAG: thioredoxin family protein [Verrucomicrobiota bacterium]|nr:thioredoxin family protein [Verrucomicrobiota bacterium]
MKILLPLATLSMIIVGIGCNQNQEAFRMDSGSDEAPAPDPRAEKLWSDDLTKAKERAKKGNKLILLDFTGSDWCPPCMALHDFVLTQPEFLDFAEKNLELVELDFPKNKPIDKKLAERNAKLVEKYNINGFPTIIVLDTAGKIIHRDVGYSGKHAKAYTSNLQKTLGR